MTDERRTVLKVLAGCAAAGAAGAAAVPTLALIGEPSQPGGAGDGAQWLRVVRLEALHPGQPTKANVVGTEVDAWTRAPDRRLGAVWLVRDSDTAVRAYSATCPHLGCAIELAQERFFCPCHESYFDLHGGKQNGPSPRGMDPLEVRIADGWVAVRYQRFRLGVPQRVGA